MKNKTLMIFGAAALGFWALSKGTDPIDIVDDCDDIVCLNGGRCREGKCQCTPNFRGVNCEIPISRQG